MAKTTIPGGYIQDNSVGIDALNVADGTNGQYLQTDGAGTLSFSTVSGYTDSDVETYLDGGTSTPTFSTATITGNLNYGTLNDGTTALTSTVAELNYLDGVTGITLGSANELLVVGGDGSSIVSDSTLAVDTSNNRLGINQSSPEVTLHMTGEGAQTAQIRMEQYNDSADAPDLRTRRYRGTIASPSAISSGDYLYRSNHEFWNGSALIVGGQFAFDNTNNANRTQFTVAVTTDGTSVEASTNDDVQFKIDGNDSGAITFNNAYKFPTSDGSANQVLTTDGSGTLSFSTVSAGPTFKTFGTDSIMIGDNATGTIDAADANTGVGVNVFAALTSGDNNTAVGFAALTTNTTGANNTAVGMGAMNDNATGADNTAIGVSALYENTASNNTAVGRLALRYNTTGSENTAVGKDALYANTTAASNAAFGYRALYANTTGQANTALGESTLRANTTASNNTAVGFSALTANTAGDNTAVGYNALASSTTATQVTALGFRAGEDSTASSSTFIGYLAGAETTTGSQNTFIGASTAESGVCTGTSNTAVGGNNFTGITTGSYNCVMGTHAMRNFQTGEGNVVLGYNAKRLHSSGDDAVVIGNHAGYNMTTGRSVVVGNEAFYDGTSTDDSVFIGNQAGYNVTTGYTNIIIGDRAGDTTLTTGYSNVIIGYKAGRSTNGFANTFVGSGAGTSSAGSYNTCIGNGANFGNNNNGGIIIGYGGTAGAAGTYATLAYGGNKSWISLGATGWSGSSDKRLKENIRPSEAGLSFINDLKPVNFDWRKKKDIDPELETHKSDSDERYEKDNPFGKIGFIAQDVKEALDNHPEVISHLWEEQEDGTQALTPNELIPILVKAVQELSAKVEELQNG
jgi:hypothetical protein